jgi:hypothetical protein
MSKKGLAKDIPEGESHLQETGEMPHDRKSIVSGHRLSAAAAGE